MVCWVTEQKWELDTKELWGPTDFVLKLDGGDAKERCIRNSRHTTI